MDGTIVDTKQAHFDTWCDALQKFGFDLTLEVFNSVFGRNNRTTLAVFLGFKPDKQLEEEIIRVKEERFREIACLESNLIPGVEQWLLDAKNALIPQAIASSAPMANIKVLLECFNLYDYFDFVVSGEHIPAKPEPDIFLQAERLFDQKPDHCLVIEDSLAGVKASKAAGMSCIAIAREGKKSDFDIADVIIEDFQQPLEEILERLGLD